jgi:hypothetical protein
MVLLESPTAGGRRRARVLAAVAAAAACMAAAVIVHGGAAAVSEACFPRTGVLLSWPAVLCARAARPGRRRRGAHRTRLPRITVSRTLVRVPGRGAAPPFSSRFYRWGAALALFVSSPPRRPAFPV